MAARKPWARRHSEAENPLFINPFRSDAAEALKAPAQHSGYSIWKGIVVLLGHLPSIFGAGSGPDTG